MIMDFSDFLDSTQGHFIERRRVRTNRDKYVVVIKNAWFPQHSFKGESNNNSALLSRE